MVMYGWAGTILRVDLTNKKIIKQPLDKEFAVKFLGGRGFNVKILYDELKPGTDPLSPDNLFIIGAGLLSGTPFAGGRVNVTFKSPKTGFLGDTNAGGRFTPELKYAGYDTIVFTGRADRPVWLWIDDDDVELRDASHLWGKTTWEVDDILKEEIGDPDIKTASIGPAGEHLVKHSIIVFNRNRAPGRTGSGAVMGSKNLKAIAVRGTKGVKVANPDKFFETFKEYYESLTTAGVFRDLSILGTPSILTIFHEMGNLPVGNFQFDVWPIPGIENLYGETFYRNFVIKNVACHGCPMHCSHFFEVRDGPFAGLRSEGLEYEGIGAMGVRPRIMYMPAVLKGNTLCNQLGLDVITAGNSIVLLMELYEKGIITKEDTEGIPIEWGDYETFLELIRKQAYREGRLGDLLAEGPYLMAKRLAKEKNMKFEDLQFYVTHSKGNDNEGWDFRPSVQIALQHAVSTRGADHLRGMPPAHSHGPTAALEPEDLGGVPYEDAKKLVQYNWGPQTYEGQGVIVHYYENVYAAQDCLEVCRFHGPFWNLPLGTELMAKAVTYLTGVSFTKDDIYRVGERVYTVEKAFNIREGWTRDLDVCSPRAYKEPIPAGPIKGYVIDYDRFEKLKNEYYVDRGWDPETGLIPKSRYMELGLPEIAEEMAKLKNSHQKTFRI